MKKPYPSNEVVATKLQHLLPTLILFIVMTGVSFAQSNICSDPGNLSGSPSEVRWIDAGTCIEVKPIPCPCPNGGNTCICTVIIYSPSGAEHRVEWNCGTNALMKGQWCFQASESGEYTFVIDVNPCQSGTVECVDCANC
jgi:hypothetical protein